MGLILAWMYNTSELDELFRILNSIKGFKLRQPQWSNTTLVLKFLNPNVNLKNVNGTTETRTGMKLEHEQMVRRTVKSVNANWKRNKM